MFCAPFLSSLPPRLRPPSPSSLSCAPSCQAALRPTCLWAGICPAGFRLQVRNWLWCCKGTQPRARRTNVRFQYGSWHWFHHKSVCTGILISSKENREQDNARFPCIQVKQEECTWVLWKETLKYTLVQCAPVSCNWRQAVPARQRRPRLLPPPPSQWSTLSTGSGKGSLAPARPSHSCPATWCCSCRWPVGATGAAGAAVHWGGTAGHSPIWRTCSSAATPTLKRSGQRVSLVTYMAFTRFVVPVSGPPHVRLRGWSRLCLLWERFDSSSLKRILVLWSTASP